MSLGVPGIRNSRKTTRSSRWLLYSHFQSLTLSAPNRVSRMDLPSRLESRKIRLEAKTHPTRQSPSPPAEPYSAPAISSTGSPGIKAITTCSIWAPSIASHPQTPTWRTHSSTTCCTCGSLSFCTYGSKKAVRPATTRMNNAPSNNTRLFFMNCSPALSVFESSLGYWYGFYYRMSPPRSQCPAAHFTIWSYPWRQTCIYPAKKV